MLHELGKSFRTSVKISRKCFQMPISSLQPSSFASAPGSSGSGPQWRPLLHCLAPAKAANFCHCFGLFCGQHHGCHREGRYRVRQCRVLVAVLLLLDEVLARGGAPPGGWRGEGQIEGAGSSVSMQSWVSKLHNFPDNQLQLVYCTVQTCVWSCILFILHMQNRNIQDDIKYKRHNNAISYVFRPESNIRICLRRWIYIKRLAFFLHYLGKIPFMTLLIHTKVL